MCGIWPKDWRTKIRYKVQALDDLLGIVARSGDMTSLSADMDKGEIIIDMGAEGGSIVLFGRRIDRDWVFTMEVDDWTPDLLDEEPIHTNSKTVETWADALDLLDNYQWSRLLPLSVHPEFRRKVWEAVQERLPKLAETTPSKLNRWRDACRDK